MIKQYKFAICDDDIQFCNKIKSYIIEYYGENKVEISIFNSGEDFIKSKVKYDCIFLDIEMINLNGIEIATMIRNYDLDTYIIIVSGFPKYKNVAYRLHVFDYLDKPLDKTMLFKTLDDMTILLQNSQIDIYEYFQTNHGLVKLKVNDIMYFEYSERKINLYTNSDSIYQFYDTIYKLEERFKQYHFISPHKAFLVNIDYIQNIHLNDLILEKDIIIPISKLKKKQIKDALDIIGKLTVAEQESLKTMLLSPAFVKSLNIEDFVAKERFANGRVCPLCGCIHVVRNGHRKDGTQRYVCKDCGKSFVIATNSIVSGTRKDLSVWEQYIDCIMNGLSIRKTAVACGIHRNTAFLWRHKILDALQNMADDVTLDGIIEADETFFAISYKGNHSKSKTFAMPRKAHKRGHSTHIRGLSQEKVCVPCAVNRNGLSISKITNTGRVSTRDLHHIYDGRIKTNSTLVTDKMNSYVRFTNANGIDLVQLKTGKAKKGIYNIQHINSYHSQLKRFMRGFNGVSTKYLNNYLVWNNLVNYAKESDMEKRNIFLTFVLATLKTAKCRDLSNRPAVPLVA